jgi:hypothetical protein
VTLWMEELVLAEWKRQLRPVVEKTKKRVLSLVAMGEQKAVVGKMGRRYALRPAEQKKTRALGSAQTKKSALGLGQKKDRRLVVVVVVVLVAGQQKGLQQAS